MAFLVTAAIAYSNTKQKFCVHTFTYEGCNDMLRSSVTRHSQILCLTWVGYVMPTMGSTAWNYLSSFLLLRVAVNAITLPLGTYTFKGLKISVVSLDYNIYVQ